MFPIGVPLKQWREQSPELREQVWVIQEVVNTLASIHAAAEPEYFWGCFSGKHGVYVKETGYHLFCCVLYSLGWSQR